MRGRAILKDMAGQYRRMLSYLFRAVERRAHRHQHIPEPEIASTWTQIHRGLRLYLGGLSFSCQKIKPVEETQNEVQCKCFNCAP